MEGTGSANLGESSAGPAQSPKKDSLESSTFVAPSASSEGAGSSGHGLNVEPEDLGGNIHP